MLKEYLGYFCKKKLLRSSENRPIWSHCSGLAFNWRPQVTILPMCHRQSLLFHGRYTTPKITSRTSLESSPLRQKDTNIMQLYFP